MTAKKVTTDNSRDVAIPLLDLRRANQSIWLLTFQGGDDLRHGKIAALPKATTTALRENQPVQPDQAAPNGIKQ